jgi:hypothetical protein
MDRISEGSRHSSMMSRASSGAARHSTSTSLGSLGSLRLPSLPDCGPGGSGSAGAALPLRWDLRFADARAETAFARRFASAAVGVDRVAGAALLAAGVVVASAAAPGAFGPGAAAALAAAALPAAAAAAAPGWWAGARADALPALRFALAALVGTGPGWARAAPLAAVAIAYPLPLRAHLALQLACITAAAALGGLDGGGDVRALFDLGRSQLALGLLAPTLVLYARERRARVRFAARAGTAA